VKLAQTYKKSFPRAWAHITSLSVRLTDKKYDGFKLFGHADRSEVKTACDPHSDPDLVIVLLPVGTDGQRNPMTGKLEVNEILVKAFEKRLITGAQLDRIVEHELTHWFDDAYWQTPHPGEMRRHGDVGTLYEGYVYGGLFIPDYGHICRRLYGGPCPTAR